MALRTADEYRESLRDGRREYILGEKVKDVTTHKLLKVAVETVAQDFVLSESEDPEIRNLFVVEDEESGEPISRFFKTPKTVEDLELRSRMIGESIRLTGGLPFGKDVGSDCLNAVTVVADGMTGFPWTVTLASSEAFRMSPTHPRGPPQMTYASPQSIQPSFSPSACGAPMSRSS